MRLTKHYSKLISLGLITAIVLILASITVIVLNSKNANAAPIVDFKPGRIIEDTVFTNSASMTPQQIQSFLNNKVPSCDTNGLQRSEMNNSGVPDYNGNGTIQRWEWGKAKYNQTTFPCLKDYTEGGRVAAQIIYDVSQQFAINPQVLIVLLQKEQSLVTDTWPSVIQYRSATGYGCPDTAACDSQYYGLTNQLTWAARMFRAILNNSPTWYTPYNLGNNYIRWSPVSSCGGSTVFIENRSTQALYNYTPYQPNASALNAGYGTGDGCGAYGNRNFYLYFRDWFGYNSGPAAFKTSDSPTIYVPVEGYRMGVPTMAALQDYGISPESIQTVSQSYVDARPLPPSNTSYSSQISHIVKSPDDNDEDGGSVYVISLGTRYQFASMEQFFSYGFNESQISYLPLGYIFTKKNGGFASNFVSSPVGTLFKLEANKKRIIFEYQTYISENPTDRTTALSYYLVDQIPSGHPVTNKPVLVQQPDGSTVSLYQNNTYYGIPSYDVLSCWGLNTGKMAVPTYRLYQSNYTQTIIANSNLSCVVNDGVSDQILNGSIRLTIPPSISVTAQNLNQDLQAIASKISLRQNPLSPYVKAQNSSTVWYIEDGKKKTIPTYTTFTLMGLSDPNVDTINSSLVDAIPENGIKLAEGQLVKTPDSASVYTISGSQRVLFSSGELFEAYKNKWSNIETFDQASLNQSYPYTSAKASSLLVNKSNDKAYIVTPTACYSLTSSTLQGLGQSIASLKQSQTFDITAFRYTNFANCTASSTNFVKTSDSSLVYLLANGSKHPLTTYVAMTNRNGGSSPTVMTIDTTLLQSLPTGQAYSQ